MKPKVLGNVGDLFNDRYYIYKDKYNEEKDHLNIKNQNTFLLQKIETYWWLSIQAWKRKRRSIRRKKQISKKPDKKEPPKKPTKDNASNFNEWVNRKETGINTEIFQKYFRYQRPSDMLKHLCRTNDKYKSNHLVNLIKNELSYLKKLVENINWRRKRNWKTK